MGPWVLAPRKTPIFSIFFSDLFFSRYFYIRVYYLPIYIYLIYMREARIFFGGWGEPFPTIAAPSIFFDVAEWPPGARGSQGEAISHNCYPQCPLNHARISPSYLCRLSAHIWDTRWPYCAGSPPQGIRKPSDKNSTPQVIRKPCDKSYENSCHLLRLS